MSLQNKKKMVIILTLLCVGGCISDFWISGQFLIKENCHNSRTSDNIGIKLGPVTEIYNRNKATSKEFGDDVMLTNCDVIVIFLIYG